MSDRNRPIPESYWVEPGRFLAGEYPLPMYTPGGEVSRRLEAFLEQNLNTFINLTNPHELPPYEEPLIERAGYYDMEVQHHRFSILDRGLPAPETMQAILDTIDRSLGEGRNIYLHCWGGIGRTGLTVGCYLVRHGRSGQEALDQLAAWWKNVPKSRFWPRSPETDEQVKFILNWNESTTAPAPSSGEQPE